MNRFVFLFALFQVFFNESIAQQDSLHLVKPPQNIQKDSIHHPILSLIDSSFTLVNQWERYPRPCIIPPKLDTSGLSIFNYDPTIQFVVYARYNARGAKADLKAGTAQILFPGGLDRMADFTSGKDKLFQKKYGVEFFSQSRVHMRSNENEAAYNQVVFAYLDQKYGDEWRNELRDDAIGFEAPEPNYVAAELIPSASMQITGQDKSSGRELNPETESSVWWYVMPTSGFALLLSLYLLLRKKKRR